MYGIQFYPRLESITIHGTNFHYAVTNLTQYTDFEFERNNRLHKIFTFLYCSYLTAVFVKKYIK